MNYIFSDEEINYILSLLAEEPAKNSMNLIINIHEQYNKNIEKGKRVD